MRTVCLFSIISEHRKCCLRGLFAFVFPSYGLLTDWTTNRGCNDAWKQTSYVRLSLVSSVNGNAPGCPLTSQLFINAFRLPLINQGHQRASFSCWYSVLWVSSKTSWILQATKKGMHVFVM